MRNATAPKTLSGKTAIVLGPCGTCGSHVEVLGDPDHLCILCRHAIDAHGAHVWDAHMIECECEPDTSGELS